MTEAQELQYIKQLFEDHWPQGTYPILWPNDPDNEPPVEAVGDHDADNYPATFLALDIENDDSQLVTSTTTEHRRRVVVSIWVELGAEEEHLRDRIHEVKELFRLNGDADGIFFLAPLVSDKAFPEDDSPWYGRAVAVPFVRYEEAVA